MNNVRIVSKWRHWPFLNVRRFMALKVEPQTRSSNKQAQSEENKDEPIKFFGSQAASWRAKDTRSGGADEHLWYQPYVISASLAVFLIYFCILREESDIDLKLQGNLFDHVQGLEEIQLTVNYKYNKQNGLNNEAVINRLKELGVDINLLDAKLEKSN